MKQHAQPDISLPSDSDFAQELASQIYVKTLDRYSTAAADGIELPGISEVQSLLQKQLHEPWYQCEVLHRAMEHLKEKAALEIASIVAESPHYQRFVSETSRVVADFPDRPGRIQIIKRVGDVLGDVFCETSWEVSEKVNAAGEGAS